MKQSESNPSMQCSVCGQWKRLIQKGDPNDSDYNRQRFFPVCGDEGQYEHEKPVCDECCKDRCPYRFKDTVVITYDYPIAPDRLKKWMWTATLNGEVQDYHKKEILIKQAEEKGLPWVVIKRMPNNYPKVLQQSS